MNDQDQLIRREAMRLDALEGIGDPDMDGRVALRASSEDSIWTAAVMPAAGYDQLSMAYDAGDTLIHRLTWHPQHGAWMLRRTYTAHHQPGWRPHARDARRDRHMGAGRHTCSPCARRATVARRQARRAPDHGMGGRHGTGRTARAHARRPRRDTRRAHAATPH